MPHLKTFFNFGFLGLLHNLSISLIQTFLSLQWEALFFLFNSNQDDHELQHQQRARCAQADARCQALKTDIENRKMEIENHYG